ncbi:MAG: OmpA family protein [Candidatus Babeliaceae bacterium]|jgi:outer membrane protein OmpA-like peptidoglycan-associated protein
MKNGLFFLTIVLFLLPSCGLKKKKSCISENKTCEIKVDYQDGDGKSLFVDDIDAFVFEEEVDPYSSYIQEGGDLKFSDIADNSLLENDNHILKTIYFDFDQYVIRQDQQSALSYNLENIRSIAAEGKIIVIEGHACDSAGSPAYNMALSHKRAQHLYNYLIKHGIPANKLKVVGRGNEMCVVQGGTREQQAPNRRVEMHVLSPKV